MFDKLVELLSEEENKYALFIVEVKIQYSSSEKKREEVTMTHLFKAAFYQSAERHSFKKPNWQTGTSPNQLAI